MIIINDTICDNHIDHNPTKQRNAMQVAVVKRDTNVSKEH